MTPLLELFATTSAVPVKYTPAVLPIPLPVSVIAPPEETIG